MEATNRCVGTFNKNPLIALIMIKLNKMLTQLLKSLLKIKSVLILMLISILIEMLMIIKRRLTKLVVTIMIK